MDRLAEDRATRRFTTYNLGGKTRHTACGICWSSASIAMMMPTKASLPGRARSCGPDIVGIREPSSRVLANGSIARQSIIWPVLRREAAGLTKVGKGPIEQQGRSEKCYTERVTVEDNVEPVGWVGE